MTWRLVVGDALERLRELPAESVQCVVTSPPYWGLRDYGTAAWEGGDAECDHRSPSMRKGRNEARATLGGGIMATNSYQLRYAAEQGVCGKCGAVRQDRQLGLEPTPELYVEHMVEVFREVRRLLRKDGTVWLNLGDSYASSGIEGVQSAHLTGRAGGNPRAPANKTLQQVTGRAPTPPGLKPKDLVGIPWRLAFALQADGWWLRSDIIWAKPNPMPESVTDRPTKAHEYVFLLTKSARYFYDADGVREPHAEPWRGNGEAERNNWSVMGQRGSHETVREYNPAGRNLRTVWKIATEPFPQAHFATFPTALVEPCIKAGTSEKGCCPECRAPWERVVERTPMVIDRSEGTHPLGRTRSSGTMLEAPTSETVGWRPTCTHEADPIPCVVLDPFAGSGTVGVVACQLGRSFIGIELNPVYAEMAERRIHNEAGLFSVQDSVK